MKRGLLQEFARRNRARVTTAYDVALLSYVAILRLSNRRRGTSAPLQQEWTIARDRALADAREGRCAWSDLPVDVPVLVEPKETLAMRGEAVSDALAQADARRVYAKAHDLAPPLIALIADLDSERGLLVADVAHARPGRPVFALRLVDEEPRAVRVR